MPASTGCKNAMLDSQTLDRVRLHDGDPGAAGTSNAIGTLTAATFAAASGGERFLSVPVEFTGLASGASVTHFSVWDNNGGSPVFKWSSSLIGDATANGAGEYTLTVATKVSLTDS